MKRRQKWFILSLALLIFVPVFGTLAFLFTEPTVKTLWESFYFTIVTMFTVGYGDVYPTTMASQIVAVFIIVGGVTAGITTLQTVFNIFVSRDIRQELGLPARRTKMKDHIILCGFGNVGQQIYNKLVERKDSFIIIEQDPSRIAYLVDNNIPVISGDASSNDTLLRANIKEAKAMILTMHDPTNIMVVISAKRANPEIYIVSEVEDSRNQEVLQKLGADAVVHCFEMGARVMVSKARRTIMDPVCGAEVIPTAAKFTSEHDGHRFYFDSKECKEAFEKNPSRFVELAGLVETCEVT